jgi:hypothetical protein
MSLSARYYYVITSLSAHIVPRNANYAHSLEQRDTFRFRLFVFPNKRLREENTNMAACDVWEWRFECRPMDGLWRGGAGFDVRGKRSRTSRLIVSGSSLFCFRNYGMPQTELWSNLKHIWKKVNIFRKNRHYFEGTRWRSWLRHCATSWKFAGSIPDGVIGILR